MNFIVKIYNEDDQLTFQYNSDFKSFYFYKYTNNSTIESMVFPSMFKTPSNHKIGRLVQYFMQNEYCAKTKKRISSMEFGYTYYTITIYDDEEKEIFYKRYNLDDNTELTNRIIAYR